MIGIKLLVITSLFLCQLSNHISGQSQQDSATNISQITGLVEDSNELIFGLSEDDIYLTVGEQNVSSFLSDGSLMFNDKLPPIEDSLLNSQIIIQDNKIYRFIYSSLPIISRDNTISPTLKNITVEIFDDFTELVDFFELNEKEVVHDVIILDDDNFIMLLYMPNTRTMSIKKISKNKGVTQERVLSKTGTSYQKLLLTIDQNVLCIASSMGSDSKNLVYLDSDFNSIFEIQTTMFSRQVRQLIDESFMVIGKRWSPKRASDNIVGIYSSRGIFKKEYSLSEEIDKRYISGFGRNDKLIVLAIDKSKENRINIRCFNNSLKKINEFDIEGVSYTKTKLLPNKIGGFTFIAGDLIKDDFGVLKNKSDKLLLIQIDEKCSNPF